MTQYLSYCPDPIPFVGRHALMFFCGVAVGMALVFLSSWFLKVTGRTS
jgi:hypothetical protein